MGGEPNRVVWRGVQPVDGVEGIWPARNSARVAMQNLQTGSGTTIVYTVPANKKLFIADAGLSTTLTVAAATRGYMSVRNVADETQYYVLFQEFVRAIEQTHFMPFCPALEADAGWDVVVSTTNANMKVRGFIFGWLEDA